MLFLEKFKYIKNLILIKILKSLIVSIFITSLIIRLFNNELFLESYVYQNNNLEFARDRKTKKEIEINGKVMIFKNGNMELVDKKEKEEIIKNNVVEEKKLATISRIFYNVENYIKNNYENILIFMTIIFIPFFAYLLRNFRYELLPFRFQFYETMRDDKIYKVYNVLHKKQEKKLIYKSKSRPNFEDWQKKKEDIRQFLKWKNLEITRIGDLYVKLQENTLTEFTKFDMKKLINNKIYFGKQKTDEGEKDYYLEFDKLTHTIIGAETGSGKSVFVQNFLMNLFFNKDKIEKIFLIDYKKMEFENYKKYEKYGFLKVFDDVEFSLEAVKEAQKIMYERIRDKKNIKNGHYLGKYIFIIIDEANTIRNRAQSNDTEGKIAKEIEKILVDINQKGRSAKIRLFMITQELSVQGVSSSLLNNMQSRMNLKTQNFNNIQKALGSDTYLTNALGIVKEDFKSFPRGRAVFRDGDNGIINMFQTPFLEIDDLEIQKFIRKKLKDNEEIEEDEEEEKLEFEEAEEIKNDENEKITKKEDEEMDEKKQEYIKDKKLIYTKIVKMKSSGSNIEIKKEDKEEILKNLKIISAEIEKDVYDENKQKWLKFIIKKYNF